MTEREPALDAVAAEVAAARQVALEALRSPSWGCRCCGQSRARPTLFTRRALIDEIQLRSKNKWTSSVASLATFELLEEGALTINFDLMMRKTVKLADAE